MGTFGSQTTPQMGPRLRTLAAAARQTLVEIAAKLWTCDATALRRRRRQSQRAQRAPVAHLWPTHQGREACHHRLGQRPTAPRDGLEDRRHARPQSQRPRICNWKASASIRHHSSRNGLFGKFCAPPASTPRSTRSTPLPLKKSPASSSSTTATSSASSRRTPGDG